MKKNPWLIIAVVQFFVIISLMSCSNNPLGVGEAGANPQQSPIQADKVMVNLSKTNMRGGIKTDEEINLQDYVNQTEPDLSDFLPGKTWTVKYYMDGWERTGYVTFKDDGSFSCDDNMGLLINGAWTYENLVITPLKYTIRNNTIEFKYNVFDNSAVDNKEKIFYSYIDFSEIKTDRLKIPPKSHVGGSYDNRGSAILTPQE